MIGLPARLSSRTGPRPQLFAGALALLLYLSGASAGSAPPDAHEILRRAEAVRNPAVDYAVDFTLEVTNPSTAWKERRASYSMIARGKDDSFILLREPRAFHSATVLIHDGSYWLLLPAASAPLQLSPRNILDGDIANGDLARGNLLSDFTPRLVGTERVRDEDCFVLELQRAAPRALSPRIVCRISVKRFFPRQLDYYGETGRLLRVATYEDYRKGSLGLRAMRIVVDNQVRPGERTIMSFTNLRRFDASRFRFTVEGLTAVRDAAKVKLGEDLEARLEDLVPLLAPARP